VGWTQVAQNTGQWRGLVKMKTMFGSYTILNMSVLPEQLSASRGPLYGVSCDSGNEELPAVTRLTGARTESFVRIASLSLQQT
jgi:hypothetical protein